jgi:ribosome-associated protein
MPQKGATIMATILIPRTELEFTYARGGGPGGQNVNKVNSKAIMRWNPSTSPSLPADVLARFLARFANKLTTEGELVISSHVHRDQPKNADECVRRLQAMVDEVAEAPIERVATAVPQREKSRRVEDKRRASARKQDRRARWD